MLAKINPLAAWTTQRCVELREGRCIPLLPLYDAGFSSIGCEPCTTVPLDPLNPRSGRWGGQKLECGIHIQPVESKVGVCLRSHDKRHERTQRHEMESISLRVFLVSFRGLNDRRASIATYNDAVRGLVAFLVVGMMRAAFAQAPQQPKFTDRVDVARIVVDVRALDGMGRAISGLDRRRLRRQDSATRRLASSRRRGWGGVGDRPPAIARRDFRKEACPRGRLIVFLFQKDLEPHRIAGLMRMLFRAKTFLDTLGPDDRVAVVSFDSHLKIWADFTAIVNRSGAMLERGLLLERPRPIGEATAEISLTRRLSQAAGGSAYPIEKGLLLIGRGPGAAAWLEVDRAVRPRLRPIHAEGVMMENGYEEALAALQRARAAVFSIDVTLADYHSLEVGLQSVSEETGGFYERSFHFPTGPCIAWSARSPAITSCSSRRRNARSHGRSWP